MPPSVLPAPGAPVNALINAEANDVEITLGSSAAATYFAKINELQQLKDEDRQHILKTLGALIREAKTRLTFG